ncbi:MAG TPA: hypothetical protein VGS08_00455 [Candidatus Saccharimonadales bacterium]|nr:hypothetical protein [Candidatus Saccharimonadales bacterium]
MAIKIVSMQVKISEAVRERAKELAKERGMNLNDLVLELFAKIGDKELKKLVEIEQKEKPRRGRPWDK